MSRASCPALVPTTTDALKALGLALILVDHVGHFILQGEDWMRVVGRWGVPIFFFLLGFARSRAIPWRWLLLGSALTALDIWWTGDWQRANINILINLALIRLAAPWLAVQARKGGVPLAILVGLLVALVVPSGWISEYGSCGWLIALVGALHRQMLEAGTPADAVTLSMRRDLVAWVAGASFIAAEQLDYVFEPGLLALFAAGTLLVFLGLRRFWRGPLPVATGARLARLLRFCGRYSLEIYAAQIILLAAIGALWSFGDHDEPTGRDD